MAICLRVCERERERDPGGGGQRRKLAGQRVRGRTRGAGTDGSQVEVY